MKSTCKAAGAVFFLFSYAEAKELTLREVEEAIRRSGATWKAGHSQVSGLSIATKKGMMGVSLSDESEVIQVPHGFPFEAADLPPRHDWRNIEGVSYTSPILDQGRCGSCVAFAATATLQDQMNITQKTPSLPWAFSPQHLFSCGGGQCDRGWLPSRASAFLKNNGIPDEACFPYQSGATGKDVACRQSCSNSQTRSIKIDSFNSGGWAGASQEAVKNALMRGPVMTAMKVYEDFLYYKGGVYTHVTGAQVGGHAVSIVGWDDSDNSWIVRNSWNTDWGEQGYFRINRNDDSGVGDNFWSFNVPQISTFLTLGSLQNREVLSGKREIPFDVRPATDGKITWTLRQSGKEVFSQQLGSVQSAIFDSTRFADGVYELQASARTGSGTIVSQPRIVYLLNGPLTGTIDFKGLADGQRLRGAIEFTAYPKTAPVPLTFVKYTVRDANTDEVVRERSTTSTGPEMIFSWKTNSVKNGNYLITFEGFSGDKVKIKPIELKVTVAN